jgi:hypothetical protein
MVNQTQNPVDSVESSGPCTTDCPCTTGWQIEFLFNYIKNIWMQKELSKYTGANAAAECALAGCRSVDATRSRGWFSLAGYQMPAPLTEEDALLLLCVGTVQSLW